MERQHDTDTNTKQPDRVWPVLGISRNRNISDMVLGMKESTVQKACIKWCEYTLKPGVIYWATSNERKAKPQHMAALKAMGMKPGIADLTFIYNDGQLRNLYIELKRPATYKMGKRGNMIIDQTAGVQSESQRLFQAVVEAIGADYHLIDNLDDFIALMKRYNLVRTAK